MATETFYVKKTDEEDYKKARELLGDNYSPYLMKSLKDYLLEWERQELGYEAVQLFEGVEVHPDDVRQGQYFKFVGKLLAKEDQEEVGVLTISYHLYVTRKGKYLLYTVMDDNRDGVRSYTKTIKDDVAGLRELGLPPGLLAKVDKNMPDLFVEVLDI